MPRAMADLRPFQALRAHRELAGRICAPPYDVVSTEEARALAAANPLTFLRVSRAEIDLPIGVDPHSEAVYARARSNFQQMIQNGRLVLDARPAYYVYRLTMAERSQTGLVALVSCQEYLSGRVRPHELTRPDKEDDRLRHIQALSAQTGPAFLVYRSLPALDLFLDQCCQSKPATELVDEGGVRHAVWMCDGPAALASVREAARHIQRLYIADGHHRTAAAVRVSVSLANQTGSDCFLAVLFPHHQLRILPYHRVVRDLNGRSPASIAAQLGVVMELIQRDAQTQPGLHEVDVFLSGYWQRYRFRNVPGDDASPVERLDVSLLQGEVLEPIFGIADPRRDERIGFVGGIRGTDELERLVKNGSYACAFALHPTRIEDMMVIADSGGLLPPKSTWFEPKLADGLFTYLLS